MAACAIALFGWEVRRVRGRSRRAVADAARAEIEAAGYALRSDSALCCEMCGARAGLWCFKSVVGASPPEAPFPVVQQLAASVAAMVSKRRRPEGSGQGASRQGGAVARLTGTIAGGSMQAPAADAGDGGFTTPKKTPGVGNSPGGGAGVGPATPAPFGSAFGKGGTHDGSETTSTAPASGTVFGSAKGAAPVFGLRSFRSAGKRKLGDVVDTPSGIVAKAPRLLADAASAAKDGAQVADAPREKAAVPYAFGNAILKALNSSPAGSTGGRTSAGQDQRISDGPGAGGEAMCGAEASKFDAGSVTHPGSVSASSKLSRPNGVAARELPAFDLFKEHRYWCPWVRQYRSRMVEHEISGWRHLLELFDVQKMRSSLPCGAETQRLPDKDLVDADDLAGAMPNGTDFANGCGRQGVSPVQDGCNGLAEVQEPVQATAQITSACGSAQRHHMADFEGRQANKVNKSDGIKTLALDNGTSESSPAKEHRSMETGLFAVGSASTTAIRSGVPPEDNTQVTKGLELAEVATDAPQPKPHVLDAGEGIVPEMLVLQQPAVAGSVHVAEARGPMGDTGMPGVSNQEQGTAAKEAEAAVIAQADVQDLAGGAPTTASIEPCNLAQAVPDVPIQNSPPPVHESPDVGDFPEPQFEFQQEVGMDPRAVVPGLVEPEFIPVNDIRVHIAEDSGESQEEGEESESDGSIGGWSDEDASDDQVQGSGSSVGHELDPGCVEGQQAAQIFMGGMEFNAGMMQRQLGPLQQPLREEPEVVDLATTSDEDGDNNGPAGGEPDMRGEAERWRQGQQVDPLDNAMYEGGERTDVRAWINGDGFEMDEEDGDEEEDESQDDDGDYEQWGNGPLGQVAQQAPGRLDQEQVGQVHADHVFEAEEEAEDEESSAEEDASSEELNQMFPDMGRPQTGSQDDDNGQGA